jgi:hypothetical protein
VIPAYDPDKKVLAGWVGKQLQYFIVVEKLPSGWTDSEQYFSDMLREMETDKALMSTGDRGSYRSESGLRGAFLEYTLKEHPDSNPVTQINHFITDGTTAYLAIVTLVNGVNPATVIGQSVAVFRTARFTATATQARSHSDETPLFGTWRTEDTAPDGKPVLTKLVMSDDLSFYTEVSHAGSLAFTASGTWSVQGRKILWNYTASRPPLPADRRHDQDQIISNDGHRVIVRSLATAKVHILNRLE